MRVQSACKTFRCVQSSHPQKHMLTFDYMQFLFFYLKWGRWDRRIKKFFLFTAKVFLFIWLNWWTFYHQFMLHCTLKQALCECFYLIIVHLTETGSWRTCWIFSPHRRTCWNDRLLATCNHFVLLVGNVRTGSFFHGQWLSLFCLPDCLVFFFQGNGIVLFYRRESTVPPGTSTTVRVPLVEVKVGTTCNIMCTRI